MEKKPDKKPEAKLEDKLASLETAIEETKAVLYRQQGAISILKEVIADKEIEGVPV